MSVSLGHVHLTVSNLDRSLKFYLLLGFEITQREESAVFLSSDGYHHHLGLNTWARNGARRPQQGDIGLFHVAFRYKSRAELAKVVQSLLDARYEIDGVGDHGVSESIYLRDPDGNGVELYVDRPKTKWPRSKDGMLKMGTGPLDLRKLLQER